MSSCDDEKFRQAKSGLLEMKSRSSFNAERDMPIWYKEWNKKFPSIGSRLFDYWEAVRLGMEIAEEKSVPVKKTGVDWVFCVAMLVATSGFYLLPLNAAIGLAVACMVASVVRFWMLNWLRNTIVTSGVTCLGSGLLGAGFKIVSMINGQPNQFEATFGVSILQGVAFTLTGGFILIGAAVVWGRPVG